MQPTESGTPGARRASSVFVECDPTGRLAAKQAQLHSSLIAEGAERGHAHRAPGRQEAGEQRNPKREGQRAKREIRTDHEDRCRIRPRIQLADDAIDELTASEPE